MALESIRYRPMGGDHVQGRMEARYYQIRVDGKTNRDAAWYYPQPSPAASMIAGRVAFWHGVSVQRVPGPGEGTAPGNGARRGLAGRVVARLRQRQG